MGYGPQRISFGPAITRMVKLLIIINVAVFLWQTLAGMAGSYGVIQIFGLTPYLVVRQLYLWQLATYLFLHGGLGHIFFNMFALWMFGSELERHWGPKPFLKFYFVTGIGAGLLSVIVDPLGMAPTIGASGAVYGVLMAYGMMFPNRLVYLYFLFPVKVKYFVAVLGLIAFFSSLNAPGSTIAHVAHLGGMVVAFIYLKGWFSLSGVKQSYYRWKLRRMRDKFTVHQGKRSQRKDDDYWIN
jgi:membrane associated rhomboid family serine protease